MTDRLTRRRTLALGAWAIPTVVLASAAPVFAASCPPPGSIPNIVLTSTNGWTTTSTFGPTTTSRGWTKWQYWSDTADVVRTSWPQGFTDEVHREVFLQAGVTYRFDFRFGTGWANGTTDSSWPRGIEVFLGEQKIAGYTTRRVDGFPDAATYPSVIGSPATEQSMNFLYTPTAAGPVQLRFVIKAWPPPAQTNTVNGTFNWWGNDKVCAYTGLSVPGC